MQQHRFVFHRKRDEGMCERLQKPVVSGKFHRRSKSSGEVWLDHRPSGTVEIGEFMNISLICMYHTRLMIC